MITDNQTLKGRYQIEVRDRHGNLKPTFQENRLGRFFLNRGWEIVLPGITGTWALSYKTPNLVVSAGKAGVASRINGAGSEAAFTYIAVGTGTTAADAADTTLEAEITDSGLERAAGTATRTTTSVTNDTAQLAKTFSVTGTKAVTEVGVLNAASAGTLLSRSIITTKNVVSGDTLTITYKIASA